MIGATDQELRTRQGTVDEKGVVVDIGIDRSAVAVAVAAVVVVVVDGSFVHIDLQARNGRVSRVRTGRQSVLRLYH